MPELCHLTDTEIQFHFDALSGPRFSDLTLIFVPAFHQMAG